MGFGVSTLEAAGLAALAFGAEAGWAAAVFAAFLTPFLAPFLAPFFAVDAFEEALTLPAFLATRLAFFTRFFAVAADLRARVLPAFFAAFFLAIVFVRVATAFRPCLEFKPDWD